MALDNYILYAALLFVGFCGALVRGVTWQPTSKLVQDLAGIVLIGVGVNYLGSDVWHITERGQAFVTGACCFAGVQKTIGLMTNAIPPLRGLFDAKT